MAALSAVIVTGPRSLKSGKTDGDTRRICRMEKVYDRAIYEVAALEMHDDTLGSR